jgi:hypothetical protein
MPPRKDAATDEESVSLVLAGKRKRTTLKEAIAAAQAIPTCWEHSGMSEDAASLQLHTLRLDLLQQLHQLRLLNWPLEEPNRVSAEDRALFEQRPCAVLPQLEVFEWTMRNPFD